MTFWPYVWYEMIANKILFQINIGFPMLKSIFTCEFYHQSQKFVKKRHFFVTIFLKSLFCLDFFLGKW